MNPCNSITEYVLIIAEKPKSARKIVDALSENPKVCKKYNVNFWVFDINGTKYVVAPTVGHLFTLGANGNFPVFNASWRPIWIEDRKAIFAKKYYNLLKSLSSRASYFINACDYDIEGSVIGYLIIKFFGDIKKAKRMKFSSLTKSEILKSFRNLSELDYNMINAGILRHKIDWLWGINVSRALMRALNDAVGKKGIVLSAGRVQSPTLINIVSREHERLLFIPEPKFRLNLVMRFNKKIIKLTLNKIFNSIDSAMNFKQNILNKKVIIRKIVKKEVVIERPPPFNLGDLQAEAGRIFGISPYKTERIAEELYLEGLISYPRTNSQQIPPTVNVNEIIKELSKGKYSSLIAVLNSIVKDNRYIVRQGVKVDPAHPAIHPTGLTTSKNLSKDMKEIYELILRRFLASISKDAIKENRIYMIDIEGGVEVIQLSSSRLIDKGWLVLYPYTSIEEEGKEYDLSEGEEGKIIDVNIQLFTSKPPNRYTRVSLLRWMEDVEIGTESTRARIIETLFKRKYVKSLKGYIVPTELGIIVTEVLERYFNELTDVKMTSDLDKKLITVQLGKSNHEEIWTYYLNKIKEYIYKYKDNKTEIGLKLAKAFKMIDYKKCKVCDFEEYREGFCYLHHKALEKLKEALKVWSERTQFSQENTLKLILKNKYTGKYVKDMVKFLSNDESHAF